jgi:threonine/homoserine efflux transporter RhtA
MAADAAPEDPARPRWTAGLRAGCTALALTLLVGLLAGLAWADGAMSAAPDAVSTGVGWLPLAVGVLVFLAVARPWRALRVHETSTVPPLRQ